MLYVLKYYYVRESVNATAWLNQTYGVRKNKYSSNLIFIYLYSKPENIEHDRVTGDDDQLRTLYGHWTTDTGMRVDYE